jgi:tetratricopeptide (TPR) repeat protein
MKKTILATILSLFIFSFAFGQDLESVTNLFNQGATLLNSDKKAALKSFEEALTGAKALGESGNELATKCKEIIPTLHISIGKEQIVDKNITSALASINKAMVLAKEYNNQEVIAEGKELVATIHLQEGNDKLNAKDFKGAIVSYNDAIKVDPENGMAYLRLGMASSRVGDETAAISALEKAAQFGMADAANKEKAMLYLRKAASSMKAKKMEEAYEFAQKSIEAFKTPQALNIGGKCAIALKKYDNAIEHFEDYLALNPKAKDAPSVMYQLAVACESTGNKDKACGYYKQIMNNPTFKEFATHKVNNELKCN